MEQFINNLRNGRDYRGKIHPELKSFVDDILRQRQQYLNLYPKAPVLEQNREQWIKRGIQYVRGPGASRVIKGTLMISAISSYLGFDASKALAVASESSHFRNAIQALSEGDLYKAEVHLFGASNARHSNCFFQELCDKVDPKAALAFEASYYAKSKEIDNLVDNSYNIRAY